MGPSTVLHLHFLQKYFEESWFPETVHHRNILFQCVKVMYAYLFTVTAPQQKECDAQYL